MRNWVQSQRNFFLDGIEVALIFKFISDAVGSPSRAIPSPLNTFLDPFFQPFSVQREGWNIQPAKDFGFGESNFGGRAKLGGRTGDGKREARSVGAPPAASSYWLPAWSPDSGLGQSEASYGARNWRLGEV